MSSRALVLSLYRRQLKASKQFNTWNFRQYFARRAREEFQKNKNETDPVKIKAMIDKARSDLVVLERQSAINRMFAHDDLIIKVQAAANKEKQLQ